MTQIESTTVNRLSKQQRIDTFGVFYWNSPHEFEFQSAEKKMLKHLAAHVKDVVENKGYSYFTADIKESNCKNEQIEFKYTQSQVLLSKLVAATNTNVGRKKNGFRYEADIKDFSSYIRMLTGPLAYHTLQRNLEGGIPSLQSTNRYIRETHFRMTECVLRCNELVSYLNDRGLPLAVSLSEDATRIIGRIQYDRKSNQLLGFVPPLNNVNGMPIANSYHARNFHEIVAHFTSGNSISSYVNVMMAQPLSNSPAFCLQLYGSDNKYSAIDVVNRWETIVKQLNESGVKVVSISSDSDPRYNSAMRQQSGLGKQSNLFNAEWFWCDDEAESPIMIQDTIHIGTKKRNFLLRTSRNLTIFGRYFIDIKHLYKLLDTISKDRHGLTKTVLNPLDKQNFSSVQKMCSDAVIHLLKTHVKGSEGTAKFLEILKAVIDAFLDVNLEPLHRVRKIWYAVFMLRLWRKFILSKKNLTLKKNFITMNTYVCVELNAHGLVKIMLSLKEASASHLFVPHLLSSQPCEAIFRQIRSLTSVYSTVVNFSVKDMLERLNKIQLQKDIMHKLSKTFNFPRLQDSHSFETEFELPTKNEIFEEIEKSKADAIKDAYQLGVVNRNANVQIPCDVNPLDVRAKDKEESDTKPASLRPSYLKNICLKNFATKFVNEPVDDRSTYVEIPSSNARRMIVKKTSLCWLLRDDQTKLSSDRLQRVKAPSNGPMKKLKTLSIRKCNKIIKSKRCLLYRKNK